ncbi:MAG: Zn-ribbon domain-containing protein [Halobacteria archaeon]
MAHQCTRCQTLFPDGDLAILNGCPSCGWNRFLFVPSRAPPEAAPAREPAVRAVFDVESIRIHETGRYEVNLRRLLERPEIVLGLKEEGKYLIHLPSLFERRKSGGT